VLTTLGFCSSIAIVQLASTRAALEAATADRARLADGFAKYKVVVQKLHDKLKQMQEAQRIAESDKETLSTRVVQLQKEVDEAKMRTADAAARVPSMDGTNNSALEVQILEEKVSYLAS